MEGSGIRNLIKLLKELGMPECLGRNETFVQQLGMIESQEGTGKGILL